MYARMSVNNVCVHINVRCHHYSDVLYCSVMIFLLALGCTAASMIHEPTISGMLAFKALLTLAIQGMPAASVVGHAGWASSLSVYSARLAVLLPVLAKPVVQRLLCRVPLPACILKMPVYFAS